MTDLFLLILDHLNNVLYNTIRALIRFSAFSFLLRLPPPLLLLRLICLRLDNLPLIPHLLQVSQHLTKEQVLNKFFRDVWVRVSMRKFFFSISVKFSQILLKLCFYVNCQKISLWENAQRLLNMRVRWFLRNDAINLYYFSDIHYNLQQRKFVFLSILFFVVSYNKINFEL